MRPWEYMPACYTKSVMFSNFRIINRFSGPGKYARAFYIAFSAYTARPRVIYRCRPFCACAGLIRPFTGLFRYGIHAMKTALFRAYTLETRYKPFFGLFVFLWDNIPFLTLTGLFRFLTALQGIPGRKRDKRPAGIVCRFPGRFGVLCACFGAVMRMPAYFTRAGSLYRFSGLIRPRGRNNMAMLPGRFSDHIGRPFPGGPGIIPGRFSALPVSDYTGRVFCLPAVFPAGRVFCLPARFAVACLARAAGACLFPAGALFNIC